jgi:Zn-dependent peptidase ImmA (M78 family)
MDKFSIIEKDWSKYDLMLEVSFQKLTYENLKELNKSFTSSKKIIGLRLMTFEIIGVKMKKDYKKVETLTLNQNRF